MELEATAKCKCFSFGLSYCTNNLNVFVTCHNRNDSLLKYTNTLRHIAAICLIEFIEYANICGDGGGGHSNIFMDRIYNFQLFTRAMVFATGQSWTEIEWHSIKRAAADTYSDSGAVAVQ